jgi:hypothetical protein
MEETMNARNRKLGLALAAVVGLGVTTTAGTADAQSRYRDRHDRSGWLMSLYDHDRDGRLDHQERQVMEFDRNRDGRLSRFERRRLEDSMWSQDDDDRFYSEYDRDRISFRFGSSARKFVRFDWNRDGELSFHEVRGSSLGEHFRIVDRDGDRRISPRELDRYHRRIGRRAHARYNPGVLRGDGYRYEYELDINT